MSAITHVEFGIYLSAIGNEMRKQNLSLGSVAHNPHDAMKQRIIVAMTSQGMSSARAPIVFNSGWGLMVKVNAATYPSRGAAAKADEERKNENA